MDRQGAGNMKILKHLQYTGRKSRPGRICFDDKGRMCVFVGYCECKGKVVMSREEAEIFSSSYRVQERRFFNRWVVWLIKRKTLPEAPSDTQIENLKRELIAAMQATGWIKCEHKRVDPSFGQAGLSTVIDFIKMSCYYVYSSFTKHTRFRRQARSLLYKHLASYNVYFATLF